MTRYIPAPPPSHKGRARTFDWDEARRLRANGHTLKELAARYGVTVWAIVLATDDRARIRSQNAAAEWNARHGNPYSYDLCACGQHKKKAAARCMDCHLLATANNVTDDAGDLWCNTCKTYRPTSEFPFSSSSSRRAFRRHMCRACDTKARQANRQKRREPCVGCGSPALPASEKGTKGGMVPRCRACFHADQTTRAKVG